MHRTTTAEGPFRPPVPDRPAAVPWSAAWRSVAGVTACLLIAGCAATGDTTSPQSGASTATVTRKGPTETAAPEAAGPGTSSSQSRPPGQATPTPVPASAVPVRPATPVARAPKDPAPRFLTVEGTTINMPIVEVGVSAGGAMEIPEPFNEAGWYRFGPAPGAAAGTAVIAAHVDTTSDSAPFSQLKSLAPGTLVTVQRDGAAPVTFRVTGVELMAKDAFDGASIFRRDGPPGLKLVTCGGRWLDEKQDYGDNVIVTAVPA